MNYKELQNMPKFVRVIDNTHDADYEKNKMLSRELDILESAISDENHALALCSREEGLLTNKNK